MKNSLSRLRGVILWNIVSSYNSSDFKTFYSNVKKDALMKKLNFACTSAQSQPRNQWLTSLSLIRIIVLFYCNKHIYNHFCNPVPYLFALSLCTFGGNFDSMEELI